MGKRKTGFISMFIIFILSIAFCSNSVYATKVTQDSQKHYVGITEMRTNDEPNMGYAIGDPKTNGTSGTAATIWNLIEYASSADDAGLKANGNKNIYCLKAGVGFTNTSKRATYDVFFDMKEEKEEIANFNGLLEALVNEKSFQTADGTTVSRYDALLALGDMLFLVDDSDEETYTEAIKNYLEQANIYEYAYDVLLTRDDIMSVQQSAIWYFTNYEEENGKYDKTSNTGWLTYVLDPKDNYTSLADYRTAEIYDEGAQRQEQAEILYNYLIKTAKENAKNVSNDSGEEITIKDTNLQYENVGIDCIVGPIEITGVSGNASNYTIDIVVKNMGVEITDYTLLDSKKAELPSSTKIIDLIGTQFYIKVPSVTLTAEQQKLADVNGDKNITQEDANLILQYDAGHSVSLQGGTGDINKDGKIDYNDAVLVLRYLDIKDNKVLTDEQIKKADVNGDGYVNTEDAKLITKYDAGLDVNLKDGTGDVNGDSVIDYQDAVLVLKYTTSYYLTSEELKQADVNGDGLINNKDAEMIMKKDVGLDPEGFIEGTGDVNGDGLVNYSDAVKVLQYIEYYGISININLKYDTKILELWMVSSEESVSADDTDEQPILMPTSESQEIGISVGVTPVPEEKDLDLALRKYITTVGGTTLSGTSSRVPNIDTSTLTSGTTATYKHKKDPVVVKTNDEVIYNLTIYNEGEKEGRATKIIDQLPTGLEFVSVESGNFVSSSYDSSANLLTLTRNSSNTTNLAGYSGSGSLASETIQIKCKVTATAGTTDKVLTNLAWIAEEVDGVTGETITTQVGKDRDSEPGTITTQTKDQLVTQDTGYIGNSSNSGKTLNSQNSYFAGQQDDDDFEKIIIVANELTSVNVEKTWNDNNNQDGLRPTEIEVELLKNGQPTGTTAKLNAGNSWKATFSNLTKKENGVDIEYTVRENTVISGYTTTIQETTDNNFTIKNTHEPEETSVNVEKAWNDNNNQDGLRLTEIEVELLKNGQPTGTTAKLNAGNSWKATFSNLPKKENGTTIEYTVRENTQIPGYTISIQETTENNFTITNTHSPEETNVNVKKVWDDSNNQDGLRPTEIEVELLKNGQPTGTTAKLNSGNNWSTEFSKLPKKENGVEIKYTVRENTQISGYTTNIQETTENNFTVVITNTHIPEEIDINVEKIWDDQNDKDRLRPTQIEVELLKNGQPTGQKEILNANNNWKSTFSDLPKKENGVEIKYTVRENTVIAEYEEPVIEQEGNNFKITNTHIVKEFDLALRKFIIAVSEDEELQEDEYLKNEDGSYTREPVVDTSKLNTTDETGKKITTAIYNHTKEPLLVKVNDYVVYILRVYNEGEKDGYAGEIKDYLPPYLEYVDNDFNKQYGWEASEDGRVVSSRYLENTLIKKPEQNENGEYTLSYAEIPIMCKISTTAKSNENITNIAEISEYLDEYKEPAEDRDSNEDNVNIPKDEELPGYKDDETGEYIPGQEDDDDFEKVVVQNFDLALRKFIVGVSKDEEVEEDEYLKNEDGTYTREPMVDTSKLNTVDKNGNLITTAIYNHTKEPVLVQKNDYVIYMLRVYNESDMAGYAGEIKDHLPPYLEYVDSEFNKKYGWEISEDGRTATTRYLEDSLIKKAELNENGEYELSYVEVPIMCKVSEKANTSENITNIADITEYLDEDKEPIIDRDSEEDNVELPKDEEFPEYKDEETGEYIPGQEDDDDFEKVIVKEFDLSLRKWVTQAIVTDKGTGQTTVTNTGHQPYDDPENVVKVEIHRKNINDVTVKFRYSIRVTNEGEIEGYAKEVTDYIPEGLKFLPEDNPGWTDEGNNIISTRLLENTLLQPGEYAEVEVVLTWINGENNMGVMNNIAEISEDYNDYGVPDIDSTPDNKVNGEDDIDDAPVMLTISTGRANLYIGLTLTILITIAGGVFLIKKYVL